MSLTRFSIAPLHTLTRQLAAVAAGAAAPDAVIRNARILSTYSDRILENREVWLSAGRIAAVQVAGTAPKGFARSEYDAKGGIIAPGLIDPHLHIESSMMTACAYAEAALLNGVTTIFCDSHEIGNVLGEDGIEMMIEDARQAPLSVFLTVPSTVPATNPDIETAGGDLTPEKIGRIFDKWPEAVALGEKMDFVAVANGDVRAHAIIAESLKRGRPVCGHVYGRNFVAAYAAGGVTDTHEAIEKHMADDLLEAGVWIFLRGGPPTTPWHSLPEAIKAVTELGASPKRFCVCTDDRDADDLFLFGLDWVVRQAVKAGVSKEQAWSFGSLHPATRFGMDGEIGGMGSGRRADLVLLNDSLEVQNTWYGGELVVEGKKITPLLDETLSNPYRYPERAYKSVTIPSGRPLVPVMPEGARSAHVIRLEPPAIVTLHREIAIPPGMALPAWMEMHDLCFVTVLERYGKTGEVAHGFLQGFGLVQGAVASSVGHDAHNIIMAGTNEADMQLALEMVASTQGGVCVVHKGKVTAHVPLPVAGLLSDKRAPAVAADTEQLKRAWVAAGCKMPYMGFNLLPLSVIPDFRLTNKGLVLVNEMRILPLFE